MGRRISGRRRREWPGGRGGRVGWWWLALVAGAGLGALLRSLGREVRAPGLAGDLRWWLGPVGHTRRKTATTRPSISASSPGIGVYAGLWGISQTWLPERLNVLTVASPSIIAAMMSPFSATGCWRT